MHLSFVFVLLLSISVSHTAHASDYNKEFRKKYYQTSEFQSSIENFCNFSTDFSASYKKQVASLKDGKLLLDKISDFENRHTWKEDINAKDSYLIIPGKPKVGTIYHFEEKATFVPFLPIVPKKNIFDYYIQEKTPDKFKGCIVYSSLPFQKAVFEYKLTKENGKYFIERTAKVIPKPLLPKSLVLNKIKEYNAKSLRKAFESILDQTS
ncbi:MAG: hypothetical protein QNJ31_04125 [Candidatus Caenarcaniphilales bacterium]|nr:hypothetical protein [Candidatus Caenarcaniphilales bacterium]